VEAGDNPPVGKPLASPRGGYRIITISSNLLAIIPLPLDNGRIINSKSVKFLEFLTKYLPITDYGEVPVKPKTETCESPVVAIKQEEETSKENDDSSSQVLKTLILLTCYKDPRTFKQAISGPNSAGWTEAIDTKLKSIENHDCLPLRPTGGRTLYPYSGGIEAQGHVPKISQIPLWARQAPKNWFETSISWFEEINYCPLVSDACLFISKDKDSSIFFHVDDLIVIGQTDKFEKLFFSRFPNFMAHTPRDESVHRFWQNQTPLAGPNCQSTGNSQSHRLFPQAEPQLLLLYRHAELSGMQTCPNLAVALKGTQHMGLLLHPKANKILDRINFFKDATWAEYHESRISWRGSLAFWKLCPILWKSKKQQNITMASTKSEMKAMGKDIDLKLILSADMIANSLTKAAPHSSIKTLQNKCLSVFSPTTKEGSHNPALFLKFSNLHLGFDCCRRKLRPRRSCLDSPESSRLQNPDHLSSLRKKNPLLIRMSLHLNSKKQKPCPFFLFSLPHSHLSPFSISHCGLTCFLLSSLFFMIVDFVFFVLRLVFSWFSIQSSFITKAPGDHSWHFQGSAINHVFSETFQKLFGMVTLKEAENSLMYL
ncbi:hypothetical protein VP01_4448g1, partial [Puccinia sorghi]